MKKSISALLILGLLVIMLAACSEKEANSTESESKDLTFAYSIMNMANPYFVSVQKGFEERAEELGIKTIVNDAKYDAPTQLSHVENYITQQVDAIATTPIDQNGLHQSYDKAKENEIYTLSLAQPVDNADTNYIVNEYDYGYLMGESAAQWINDNLGGEAEVLLITQDNVESVVPRGDGLQDAIEEFAPNAKIVARQAGDTPEKAMEITENILQAHPNVKVVATVNDSSGIGAYEAVNAMGMATKDFYVGGADATDEAVSKMKEDDSIYRFTADIDPYGSGKKMVDMMVKAIEEGTFDEAVYFEMKPIWQNELE